MNTIISPSVKAEMLNRLIAVPGFEESKVVTEKIVRLEQNLVNTIRTYTFNPKASTGAGDRPLEVKLDQAESFGVIGIAVGVQRAADAIGTNQAQNNLYHHADTTFFSAAEQAAINAIYAGHMTIKVKGSDKVERMSMSMFKFDPGTDNYTHGPTLEERGFFVLDRGFVLNGLDVTEISIEIPALQDLSGAAAAATAENVLVVEFFGGLSKGTLVNTSTGCNF